MSLIIETIQGNTDGKRKVNLEMTKLTICIPVLNRQNIFRHCLQAACEACIPYANDVEIVVSDNHSEEDIPSVFSFFSDLYPTLSMKFHRNLSNLGFARNYLQVISMASAQFCWVIGSDDFIYSDAVGHLLRIMNDNSDIDFICCNYDLIDVKEWQPGFAVRDKGRDRNIPISRHEAFEGMKCVDSLRALILPETNNVYFGAMMTGVFRRARWNRVNKTNMQLDGYSGLESVYPHCAIYARGFLDCGAYYCGYPLVIVGEGTREWSTEAGNTFWQSSLPIIYFNILGQMLAEYYANGLERQNYLACMNENAYRVGLYFPPLVKMKAFHRTVINNGTLIKPFKILLQYGRYGSFYAGAFQALRNKRKILRESRE